MNSSRPPMPYLVSNSCDGLLRGAGNEGHGARRPGRAVSRRQKPTRRCLPNSALEEAVQRTDDVADHRFGRVVNAAALALGGVVLGEESFVEVNDGIAALAFVIVAVEDAGRVGHGQNFGDVVHAPGQLLGQIAERDEAEQIAQDADGVGDVVEGGPAAKSVFARVRAAKRP